MARPLGFKFLNGFDSRGLQVGELDASSLSAGSLSVSTIQGQGGGGVSFSEPISNVTFEEVVISGGTINNVSIGTEVPGIGFFTNLNVVGNINVSGNIISQEGSEAQLGNLQIVENTISAIAPAGDGDIILDPLGVGDVIVNGPFVVNANTGSEDVTINADDIVDINGENQLVLSSDSGDVCIESADDIKLIAGDQIQLTPTSNVLVAADKPIQFANGSNTIVSDGTDLTISGNAGDVNINANTSINLNQNTTISGNLTVSGTTTTVNSTTVDIVDPVIQIGEDLALTTKDRGIEFKYNDGVAKTGFFGWDQSENKFVALVDATNTAEEFSGTPMDARFGDLEVNSLTTDTICGNPGLTLKTIGGADIELQASAGGDVNLPADIGLTFGGDGQKIESNGTNLTINSGADIDLTATADINVPADVGLTFGGDGQKIESNGTDLAIDSGTDINLNATADVNVPADVGLTFGGDGQKIESNGTDLAINSGTDINLFATADVNIPDSVGLTFGGDGQKIENNGTDLAINSGTDINLNATTAINVPASVPITFGANDSTNIQGDGTDLFLNSDTNVDISAVDINLNATDSVDIPVEIPLEFGNANTEIHGSTSTLINPANPAGNVNLFLESDCDIYLVPAIGKDVIIPEDIGLQFGTSNGNRIEYDGTDLCIFAENELCLDAGGDVSVTNNLVVGGDLTVTGALNTSSSVGSDVDTPIIQLGDQINEIIDGQDETPGANQIRLRVENAHYLVAGDIFTVRESSEAAADGQQTVDSIPTLSFNVDVTSGSATVTRNGGGGDFTTEDIIVNDYLTINGETKRISTINTTSLTMDSVYAATASNQVATIANQLVFTDSGVSANLTAAGTIKYFPTVDDNLDRGVQFNYHEGGGNGTVNTKKVFVGWDDSLGKVVIRKDITNTGNVITGDLGELALAELCVDDLTANGADIDLNSPLVGGVSGSIDNIPIGGTVPNTGAFTTLSSTLNTTIGQHLLMSVENISGAGGGSLSPSSAVDVSFITVTGSGVLSGTMPAGTLNGQLHHVVMESVASGASYELTFAINRLTDPGTGAASAAKKLTMDCGSQGVLLIWSTTTNSWFILNGGANIVAP